MDEDNEGDSEVHTESSIYIPQWTADTVGVTSSSSTSSNKRSMLKALELHICIFNYMDMLEVENSTAYSGHSGSLLFWCSQSFHNINSSTQNYTSHFIFQNQYMTNHISKLCSLSGFRTLYHLLYFGIRYHRLSELHILHIVLWNVACGDMYFFALLM